MLKWLWVLLFIANLEWFRDLHNSSEQRIILTPNQHKTAMKHYHYQVVRITSDPLQSALLRWELTITLELGTRLQSHYTTGGPLQTPGKPRGVNQTVSPTKTFRLRDFRRLRSNISIRKSLICPPGMMYSSLERQSAPMHLVLAQREPSIVISAA